MGDFKTEYKRAVDRLEPDGRLIESLKADMKAAKNTPPKPNFFIKYGWVFGSAAACIAVVLAVSVFFALGRSEQLSEGMMDGAANNGAPEMVENAADNWGGGNAQDAPDNADGDEPYPSNGTYAVTTTTVSQPSAAGSQPEAAGSQPEDAYDPTGDAVVATSTRSELESEEYWDQSSSDDIPPFSIDDMPFTDSELSGSDPITDRQLREWAALAEQGELTYGELEKCAHVTKLYKGLYTMGCVYLDEGTGQSYVLISCYFVQSADSAPAYVVLREMDSGDILDLLRDYYLLDRFLAQ